MTVAVPNLEIAADKRSVSFVLIVRGVAVTCVVSRAALKTYFLLTQNADDNRTLKAVIDGFDRIQAMALRKARARPAPTVSLTRADFKMTR
ncbi:DUF1488 family protein [Caballeronia sp. GAFFF1]|uniref:DUF1488 family protein n=1 Tax=Caballeronia sp. GAFFF1 TaxID=2921779 RepID=UPI002028F6E6|nr:DUF1488 family protein [Caballeronia sp. GAFFF1]